MSERGRREKFVPGIEYYNPYRPPGKPPDGFDWKCSERHVDKGYPLKWRLVSKAESEQPPSIDELAPLGTEGPLSKEPPRSFGGVTPQQLEESKKRRGPMTHAAHVAEAFEDKED